MRLRADQSWFTRAVFADVALAFALSFLIGFERELRGAPAGDRTYALVGTAAAAVTVVAANNSPQAIAGVLTGVGFIGAGVILHDAKAKTVHGLTTAATVWIAAGLGIACALGAWLLVAAAIAVTLLVLFVLGWVERRLGLK